MKKMLKIKLLAAVLLLTIGLSSCGKKDEVLQKEVETAVRATPGMENLSVAVEKGVVTLTGECKDDACKAKCAEIAKGIKGVKEVVSNCTITPAVVEEVAAVVPEVADALTQAITDALKDYPTVQSSLSEGVLTLTGEVSKDKIQKMMMGLNALKQMGIKKIESKDLVKK
jgi:hyperosmotically inducible periplasmic protein